MPGAETSTYGHSIMAKGPHTALLDPEEGLSLGKTKTSGEEYSGSWWGL